MHNLFHILLLILSYELVLGFNIFNGLPYYANYALSANISAECKSGIKWLIEGIKKKDLAALKMVDASTKLPANILNGHLTDFGDFSECMEVKNQIFDNMTINGKYCMIQITIDEERAVEIAHFITQYDKQLQKFLLENLDYRLIIFFMGIATCIPDSCGANDINTIMPFDFANVVEESCTIAGEGTNISPTWDSILIMIFFSAAVVIVMACTIYDIVTSSFSTQTEHQDFIKAFSAYSNIKKLLNTKKGEEIDCICGISSIAMMCVISGHSYGFNILFPKSNSLKIVEFVLDRRSMFILEAHLHVDTFLVIGGILATYTYLEARRRGITFNIPLYYLHRFLRMFPVLLVSILIYKYVFRHLGSGPMWPLNNRDVTNACENEWWKPLTFLQNYIFDYSQTFHCSTESWYLALDMQLRILSPLVLIPMNLWPKLTLSIMAILTGVGIMIQILIIHTHELTNFGWTFLGTEESKRFLRDYYYPLQTRYPSYLIGMIAGYFIHQHTHNNSKNKIQVPKIASAMLWVILIIGFYLCIYSGHVTYVKKDVTLSAFTVLKRSVWSVLIVSLIGSCILNPEGLGNKFLSASVFKFLSRLSLSMYLLHMIVITANIYSTKLLEDFSPMTNIRDTCFYYIQTLLLALIITLVFESPTRFLEKQLIGKKLTEKGKLESNGIQDEV